MSLFCRVCIFLPLLSEFVSCCSFVCLLACLSVVCGNGDAMMLMLRQMYTWKRPVLHCRKLITPKPEYHGDDQSLTLFDNQTQRTRVISVIHSQIMKAVVAG